ncbi:MAG TPA: hypothetical protein V6C52_05015 [Coleofasciculaceae cyanobacterium]|jgi:hypothetical protein
MRLQFQGVTIYSGNKDAVLDAFDQHTEETGKPRTVGAFYKGGAEAVVLDNVDYDSFCARNSLGDIHDPHNPYHQAYFYYHPADSSYFSNDISDYLTQQAGKDALKMPISNVKV